MEKQLIKLNYNEENELNKIGKKQLISLKEMRRILE